MIILSIIILGIIAYFGYEKYQDYLEEERIRNAIIKVELVENLEIEFKSDVQLSDLIQSINGTLCDDFKIDTGKIASQEILFYFVNEEGIKVPYKFNIKVVDKTPPVIWLGEKYTVKVGTDKKLEEMIMCGDNLDDTPKCTVIGEYDLNKAGEYHLKMEAEDKYGNTSFKELYKEYKNDTTKIGIDVSKWQGDIDFQKVKDEGVEFVYIKLGGQNGIGKDYYLDPKFERNYEGFKKVNIPIGLYFYSYADSQEEAKRQALWIMNEIKNKEIDLPIAFDWESWNNFNQFKISFYRLTLTAESFMNTLKEHGYHSMLYSSKNYLEQIWFKTTFPTWLAHYTENTSYEGDYKCWQRTNMAKISGISGNTVDFDICYDD